MRVAVLLEERCKPNSNAFAYLKKYSDVKESAFRLRDQNVRFWKRHVPFASLEPSTVPMGP